MALIKCPECGKDFSDHAITCPHCGYVVNLSSSKKKKSDISYIRLAVSILLIVSSLFVIYQSFFAGLNNAISITENIDGTIGFSFALFEIAFGVIGIVTCKSKNSIPVLIQGSLMMIIGVCYAVGYEGIYKDLKIWGLLLIICGIVFILSVFIGLCKSEKRMASEAVDEQNCDPLTNSQAEKDPHELFTPITLLVVIACIALGTLFGYIMVYVSNV